LNATLASRVVLVPFHLARLGKRIVGLDAFFWPSLDKRYRVVLLVHPAERLGGVLAEYCRLPVRVSAEEQVEEVRSIARRRPEKPHVRRAPLWRRIAWLFMPMGVLRDGQEDILELSEELQAVGLARTLRGLEPLGETRYAVFEHVEAEQGRLLLPVDESMRRIYLELARRDQGYQQALEDARC